MATTTTPVGACKFSNQSASEFQICKILELNGTRQVGPPPHMVNEGDPSLGDTDPINGSRQFPNALRVTGMLHISDNCLGNILSQCACWPKLLQSLRTVETLLGSPLYRERLSWSCIRSEDQHRLKGWNASLKGLRWQAVLNFVLQLLPLETMLR